MSFVDFAEVKASHPIETVAESLSLKMTKRGEQLRGPCPACEKGGDRALVITPAKAAFYCFAGQTGGDAIALAAHIRGETMKEAASWIVGDQSRPKGEGKTDTVPNERKGNEERRLLKPLTYLEPDHEALKSLGISPETLEAFGAGYAPKGIMRGRLAIPIRGWGGELIAYCGQAVADEQSPKLIFPNGFEPERHIFNADRTQSGDLILARDPLAVLSAADAGIDNLICLLTPEATSRQLQMLAALMDERAVEVIEVA